MQFQETSLVGDALRRIANLLPDSWLLETEPRRPNSEGRWPAGLPDDAAVSLVGPTRERVTFSVEARQSGTAADLLLARLRERARAGALPLLFVSDYIGPSLREKLAADGISYADATGWVRITSAAPLILLTGQGAEKAPRAGRPTAVVRLNGVAANRIIRALCVEGTPLGVRELASRADVSPGSVSKLLTTLAAEGIVDRDQRGAINEVRRRALVQRWARDYSYLESNGSVGYFIAPRGLDRALSRAREAAAPVTLAGSAAARTLLPGGVTSVVPLRLLALYTDDTAALADQLGLIPAEPATANTVLAVPQDGGVLEDDIAPVALVLADLLTLPGRGGVEAEQLMDALARADDAWRA